MINIKNKMPWVVALMSIAVAIVFSVSNIAIARKESHSNGVNKNNTSNSNVSSLDDDGTPDQGRGDVLLTPASNVTPSNTTASGIVEIEADVFTDITIVKIEVNDSKSFYETKTRDRDSLILEISNKYGIDVTGVTNTLQYQIEDRASRTKDRS